MRTGLEPATPCVTGMYSNQAELPHQVPFRDCKLFLNTKFLFYVCKDFDRQCRQVKNPGRIKKVRVRRMSKLKVDIDPKYSRYASEISAIPSAYDNLNVTKTFCNNRNCVSLIKVRDFDWVLKRYRRPIFINSVIYTFIRPNKAVRAYRYAKRLLEMGIETPYPVAYMATYRFGLFDIGYFISDFPRPTGKNSTGPLLSLPPHFTGRESAIPITIRATYSGAEPRKVSSNSCS